MAEIIRRTEVTGIRAVKGVREKKSGGSHGVIRRRRGY